ncbi:N,N-dimethylformamidase beta subunit family domain-containing protein [Nocardioides sp. SR21]|uniref:N,N-dimethylformamidase beta subunit family domain-containing protein n=1 Tax=Nocardioides sp. SR21 TaxID=2919501 RepID=UPI001FA9F90D|nr:N,N-dimethylformamidase beta subunit family domain-containing protein [Nocardioides sp. SR21]
MRTYRHHRRTSSLAGLVLALTLITTACSAFEAAEGPPADLPEDQIEPTARPPSLAAATTPRTRGSEDWRLREPAAGRIAAYTTHISAPPGTRVGLKVSTVAPRYRVSAYRIGWYPGGTGALVWRSPVLEGQQQADAVLRPVETRTVVAPWRTSQWVDTTGWDPGFYVLKVRMGSGGETLVPYVVSSPSAEGTVALVSPVTTWQAYNEWGGYSLYHGPDGDRRSWAVSFDRPFNGATGANDYRTAAIPVVVRAERLGIPLSYYTNVDLHQDPGLLQGAAGYVSMGHDEYWTPAMRRAVEKARDGGTNLAFLGANTMYWRIRLDETHAGQARLQTGYRSDAHLDPLREERPREATSRFRDAPAAESEQGLVGMEYECYPVDADFVVASPTWWGFRGTGARSGDRMPGLVGPEADRVYLNASTPRPMEVLSHTSYPCGGVTTTSQSVYYTTDSGAGVFTAGTLRWGCALIDRCDDPLGARVQRFVHQVTLNLLRTYAAGPVGFEHPARDTVTRYHLPDLNSVGAS